MRKFFLVGLTLILLVGLTTTAAAYDVKERFSLGGNVNIWPTGGGSLLLFGLSGAYGFSPNIQGELAIDIHSSTGPFWGQHTILTIFPLWLSGKYVFIPKAQLNPYISGGLFWITGNIYPTEDTFRYHGYSRAGLHLGCGADFFLNEDFALNGDLRLPVGAPGFDGLRINFGGKYFFKTTMN